MNSKQRRAAYRAMPKAGASIRWTRPNGSIASGTVVGPVPADTRYCFDVERRNVPGVNRVHVQLDGIGSGFAAPKLSWLIA